MEDNKKPQEEQPEAQLPAEDDVQQLPEKKLSRTTLTFYIIGLFLVAIALILVSYISQVRSNKQLQNLNTQLSDQQKVAQGATQKMEDLQKRLDEMSVEIEGSKQSLGLDAQASLSEGVQRLRSREQLLMLLISAEEAARAEDMARLANMLDGFTDAWPATDLKPESQGGLFHDDEYAAYQSLLKLSGVNNQ